MEIFIRILMILFFWLGSVLGIVFFREKNLDYDVQETLERYWYYYLTYNVLLTLFLVLFRDFRYILITTIIMCVVHYINCKKELFKVRKRNKRKKFWILKIEIEKSPN